MLFQRNPLAYAGEIEQPDANEIKATPSLFNSSLEDALMYGGDLTRAALGAMNLRGDKKHIIVDTKVHMLMPGMYPAIPGWHTDGAPRSVSKGPPDLYAQAEMDSPRFHLLVTGAGCLTDFLGETMSLDVPEEPTNELYKLLSDQMNGLLEDPVMAPRIRRLISCRVLEWDWWDLHTAIPAGKHEWRFLIRVTETDYRAPKTDLRDVLRSQQQVYVPESFGW